MRAGTRRAGSGQRPAVASERSQGTAATRPRLRQRGALVSRHRDPAPEAEPPASHQPPELVPSGGVDAQPSTAATTASHRTSPPVQPPEQTHARPKQADRSELRHRLAGRRQDEPGTAGDARRETRSPPPAAPTPADGAAQPSRADDASRARGRAADSKKKSEAAEFIFKVAVVGDSGVGKTSVLSRWSKLVSGLEGHYPELVQEFPTDMGRSPPPPLRVEPTIGVDFAPLVLHEVRANTRARLQLWDTSGHGDAKGMVAATSTRNAAAAVVVYDVSQPSTLRSVRTHWLPLLASADVPPSRVLLLGNKQDLRRERGDEGCVTEAAVSLLVDELPERTGRAEASASDGGGVSSALQRLVDLLVEAYVVEGAPGAMRSSHVTPRSSRATTPKPSSQPATTAVKGGTETPGRADEASGPKPRGVATRHGPSAAAAFSPRSEASSTLSDLSDDDAPPRAAGATAAHRTRQEPHAPQVVHVDTASTVSDMSKVSAVSAKASGPCCC